jgi:CBS domain-containing protein
MGLFGEKKVRDAMSERPRAVTPETSAMEAARAMATEDVGSLPVVQNGRLKGIVTDRDLAIRVVGEGADYATPVGAVLSTKLVTVRPQDSLELAMDLMAQHQVRRLPVVGESDELVGVVAQADVALAAGERDTGDVVQAISEQTTEPRV